ncbi:hypothetical protein Tco_0602179 [Tanacetum coccineum]
MLFIMLSIEAGSKDVPPMLEPWLSGNNTERSFLSGIDNDIYSIVDACPNACEMWKAIERFYKMMNELVRNQCDVTNHQVNVQFLLQLQSEWQKVLESTLYVHGTKNFKEVNPDQGCTFWDESLMMSQCIRLDRMKSDALDQERDLLAL